MAQGKQLQYDSYRKNLAITPEDSTSMHTTYTVCSGLTYMSYKQALNMEIPDTTDDLLSKKSAKLEGKTIRAEIIYPKDGVSSREEFKKFIKSDNKLSSVEPGDILVWKGHAMLIERVDLKKDTIHVIHATGVGSKEKGKADGDGGRYDTSNQKELVEESGAVHRKKITASNIKNTDEIAIVRYIHKNNNVEEITPAAKTRLKYKDISVAKIIVDVKDQSFASVGDELTYQIRIRNNGDKKYENIKVSEKIDTSLVELVSANLNTKYLADDIKKAIKNNKASGASKITWEIPEIKPGKYVTLQYTVKIKKTAKAGDILTSTGKVGNIATSKIETLIGKTLTSAEVKKLKDTLNKSKAKLSKTSSRAFINSLYEEALDINLGILSLSNFTKLFSYDKVLNKIILNNSIKNENSTTYYNSVQKYVYSNFYGLRIRTSQDTIINSGKTYSGADAAWNKIEESELSGRARTVNSSMLKDGDVILKLITTKENNITKVSTRAYIYLDKKLHTYKKENNKVETLSGEKLEEFLGDLVGDYYIILRPYKD